MERAEPAEGDAEEPVGADDEPSAEPTAELLTRRATLVSERAAADVIAILAHAEGLRRAVELAARSRTDPDAEPLG